MNMHTHTHTHKKKPAPNIYAIIIIHHLQSKLVRQALKVTRIVIITKGSMQTLSEKAWEEQSDKCLDVNG
jgi:hypothetical protein